jgi:hypothetical protein
LFAGLSRSALAQAAAWHALALGMRAVAGSIVFHCRNWKPLQGEAAARNQQQPAVAAQLPEPCQTHAPAPIEGRSPRICLRCPTRYPLRCRPAPHRAASLSRGRSRCRAWASRRQGSGGMACVCAWLALRGCRNGQRCLPACLSALRCPRTPARMCHKRERGAEPPQAAHQSIVKKRKGFKAVRSNHRWEPQRPLPQQVLQRKAQRAPCGAGLRSPIFRQVRPRSLRIVAIFYKLLREVPGRAYSLGHRFPGPCQGRRRYDESRCIPRSTSTRSDGPDGTAPTSLADEPELSRLLNTASLCVIEELCILLNCLIGLQGLYM